MTAQPEANSEPISGYRLIERIDSGGYGEVWKAEAPGGIFKAIKIIYGDLRSRTSDEFRLAEQELKSLKRVKEVRHPYLLALDRFDIIEGRLHIVMELADCNLSDRFRACRKSGLIGIPREELLNYMAEAAEVLDLMNDRFQLQHLDIKPQNLFLLYNHVKVADFGQVKDLQGLMVSVTGGITPVYAAPETFDGLVSRFCDQYSLACVYQELLTGQRPFNGTTMQQLLIQHLQQPPDLSPLPQSDRSAISKALSKKPEDRFPSCTAMVRALRYQSMTDMMLPPIEDVGKAPVDQLADWDPSGSDRIEVFPTPTPGSSEPAIPSRLPEPPEAVTPEVQAESVVRQSDVVITQRVTDTVPPRAEQPLEITGNGPLRPTLVIGLGFSGLRVLQRFQRGLEDRHGFAVQLPAVRMMYLDTDPAAMAQAHLPMAPGLAGIDPSCAFSTPLHRPTHYLKENAEGQTLIDGWFDPQLLYKLPREPVTLGIRCFGRLALLDHYEEFNKRLKKELMAMISPAALASTSAMTRLEFATNRPRVYIVAGLGGGTGSGMLIDVAYAVRNRLKRLGYRNPDIIGVLMTPYLSQPSVNETLIQSNTYAALTELRYYSRLDVTHVTADNEVSVGPAFSEVCLFPGRKLKGASFGSPVGSATGFNRSGIGQTMPSGRYPESPDRDPAVPVGDFLRHELYTPMRRARVSSSVMMKGISVHACGLVRFAWPRGAVLDIASRELATQLLKRWSEPPARENRQLVSTWVTYRRARLGLETESQLIRFHRAVDTALGSPITPLVTEMTTPLMPKKWFGRLPEPATVASVLEQFRLLLGAPGLSKNELDTSRTIGLALTETINVAYQRVVDDSPSIVPELVSDPTFRPAGAEEALKEMIQYLEFHRSELLKQSAEHEAAAKKAYELLAGYAGDKSGKPSNSEFSRAIVTYPTRQYEAVVCRGVAELYRLCKELFTGLLGEILNTRRRIDQLIDQFQAWPKPNLLMGPRDLLPPGCQSEHDAAMRFLEALNDQHIEAVETQVLAAFQKTFGSLHLGLRSGHDSEVDVVNLICTSARTVLDALLGEVDLAGMFWHKFGPALSSGPALVRAYEEASPSTIVSESALHTESLVLGCPSGSGGSPLRTAVLAVLPPETRSVETSDELVIFRYVQDVSFPNLQQLSSAWANAYQATLNNNQTPPHSRTDITDWIRVDGK